MVAFKFEREVDFYRFCDVLKEDGVEYSLLGGSRVTIYNVADVEQLPMGSGKLFKELKLSGLARSWVPVGLCV